MSHTAATTDIAVAYLERLVSFNTISALSNLDLIDYLETELSGLGGRCERVASTDGRKANLIASFGPTVTGGVALSGHTDVVPVTDQPWETDPFALVRKDDKLFARGTSDMKGFLACCMALAKGLDAASLKQPLRMVFSYDEEVGCLGAGPLVNRLAKPDLKPDITVVGEPTGMKVVTAHKGINGYRTMITGSDGHSSASHMGANAIIAAGEILAYIQRQQKAVKDEVHEDSKFDPPYTTYSVGTIEGGTAVNVIPRRCVFTWEMRPMPGVDANAHLKKYNSFAREAVLPRLVAVAEDADIETEVIANVPPFRTDENGPAAQLALSLTGENDTKAVSFGTEAGIFQGAGISTVVCGPGHVAQAHQPNEFIEVGQIDSCVGFLNRLAAHVS